MSSGKSPSVRPYQHLPSHVSALNLHPSLSLTNFLTGADNQVLNLQPLCRIYPVDDASSPKNASQRMPSQAETSILMIVNGEVEASIDAASRVDYDEESLKGGLYERVDASCIALSWASACTTWSKAMRCLQAAWTSLLRKRQCLKIEPYQSLESVKKG